MISEVDKQALAEHGYTVLKELGEGKTRKVYKLRYAEGEVDQLWVGKVPVEEVSQDSICTQINTAKVQINRLETEASVLNRLKLLLWAS